jgi:hypothetical protein
MLEECLELRSTRLRLVARDDQMQLDVLRIGESREGLNVLRYTSRDRASAYD